MTCIFGVLSSAGTLPLKGTPGPVLVSTEAERAGRQRLAFQEEAAPPSSVLRKRPQTRRSVTPRRVRLL